MEGDGRRCVRYASWTECFVCLRCVCAASRAREMLLLAARRRDAFELFNIHNSSIIFSRGFGLIKYFLEKSAQLMAADLSKCAIFTVLLGLAELKLAVGFGLKPTI
jgi:hypothetical protein